MHMHNNIYIYEHWICFWIHQNSQMNRLTNDYRLHYASIHLAFILLHAHYRIHWKFHNSAMNSKRKNTRKPSRILFSIQNFALRRNVFSNGVYVKQLNKNKNKTFVNLYTFEHSMHAWYTWCMMHYCGTYF